MKAAKNYKEKWEEENLLLLINFSEQFFGRIWRIYQFAYKFMNVLLYVFYKLGEALLLILKLVFLSEPMLNKIEREESWIFRQIK
ncbi:MAG: hypothetical protein ACXVAX_00495 [Pseudobdellovibrio sp.]